MKNVFLLALLLSMSLPAAGQTRAGSPQPGTGKVPTPESVLGYSIGAEGHLTRYAEVLKYFGQVAGASDRVKLVDLVSPKMESNVRQVAG